MKTLIVLNEHPIGSHPDVYEAFSSLVDEGSLAGFEVLPYLHLLRQGFSHQSVSERIRETAIDGRFQQIIWMHTGDLRVSESVLEGLSCAPQIQRMLYWESDSYHPLYKPIPNEMIRIMRRCEAAFLPCAGPIIASLKLAGVRTVLYAPSCASGTRFPRVWDSREDHPLGIVVVGNRVSSRVPFKTMPGARRRSRLVRMLTKRYGSLFSVFGNGWSGDSAMGPINFDDQSRIYRSARVTVGVNNSTYPYVFSNRLPVALASGIPLLYHRNPGFDKVFAPDMQRLFFGDDADLMGALDSLLDADPDELTALSSSNREYFEENFERAEVARFVALAGFRTRHEGGHTDGLPRWQRLAQLGWRESLSW